MSSFHSFPQANVTGRNAKTVREYLEKHYSPEAVKTRDDTIVLAIKALLEVVQSGSKSMEVAVMERGKPLEVGCRVKVGKDLSLTVALLCMYSVS